MSAEDDAYEAAKRLIAEAKREGQTELRLVPERSPWLRSLPTELAELTQLRSLYVSGARIADLSLLSRLPSLEQLSFSVFPESDLSTLRDVTQLKTLWLDSSGISDVTALARMTELTELYLGSTPVRDISPLIGLKKLRKLDLGGTAVADLTPMLEWRKTADLPDNLDMSFHVTPAALGDEVIAKIAEIGSGEVRTRALFAYLNTWVPQGEASKSIDAALQGPILSDALADVTKPVDRFEATSLTDAAERPVDGRHNQLLQTVQVAAQMLGRAEVQNRIGRDVAESFVEYARFSQIAPANPRVLNYLANSVRSALLDPETAVALDAFDKGRVSGFLAEHDALIREYYPSALAGPKFEVETDPEVLVTELFPKLASAKEILQQADRDGLFAPSVSDALEMLERRVEGARRSYLTTGDAGEKAQAGKELQRNGVLVTAYLGRINARLSQWIEKQIAKAKEDPVDGMLRGAGLLDIAQSVVSTLKPVFEALWTLIGKLPLPF